MTFLAHPVLHLVLSVVVFFGTNAIVIGSYKRRIGKELSGWAAGTAWLDLNRREWLIAGAGWLLVAGLAGSAFFRMT